MIYQWHLVKNVKSVETFSDIRWMKENDLFPPNHRETVIRTVILVIIVQPWSIIIIMEAFSYSIVINCCCLWLNCLLDLTLKSFFYCAATLEAWICHPSVRVCALLCVTVPPAGAHSLFELPLICQWDSRAVRQKWQAGCVKHQPLSVLLMVNKCSSYSLSYVQKGSHSALTTQSPIEKHAR